MSSNSILPWFVVCCLAARGFAQFSKKFTGPYEIIVKGLDKCDNEGTRTILIESNKLRRYNRTVSIYSSNIFIGHQLTDKDTKLIAALAVFGNGGWRKNYFKLTVGGICSSLIKYVPKLTTQIFNKLGIEGCPIPMGNYTCDNLILTMDSKWPEIPYNKYMADFSFSHKGTITGCKRLYMDVIPKSGKN